MMVTKWFNHKQNPVRNGKYQVIVQVLGYDCGFLVSWSNDKGWHGWPDGLGPIKRWRGLTKEEYKRRKADATGG